jgi:tetratricopeptide (TPR) repeat protein
VTAVSLARALAALEAGDLETARGAIGPALAAAPDDPSTLHAAGRLALALRRPADAVQLLQRAAPRLGLAAAWSDLGRGLNNLRRLQDAEAAFRRALELDPADAGLHDRLGHVLRSRNRIDEALEAFRKAAELDPGRVRAWRNLGATLLAADQPEEARAALLRARELDPDDVRVREFLAASAHAAGDLATATAEYRALLGEHPELADAWANLGMALQDAGDLDGSVEAYRAAVARQPADSVTRNRLGDALLAAGRPGEAMASADRCLEADPGNPGAIAAQAVALVDLDREAEARDLLAMNRVVRAVPLAPPPGYASLGDFNRDLVDFVAGHPSRRYEPVGHATRKGSHTRDLLGGDPGPVGLLADAIRTAVTGYIGSVSLPARHPFPGPVPADHRLVIWAVIMDQYGHQLPHIHPAAWLSGVYYAELPEDVGVQSGHEGWIEFGQPPDELVHGAAHPVQLFRPAEGTLFLFPSYLYHRTVPFSTGRRRVSLAVDVLRRA